MSTIQNLSKADSLFVGRGYNAGAFRANRSRGVPVSFPTRVSLGAPKLADVNYLVDAATSTELPNNATITYTPATDGTSPLDNADSPVPETITETGSGTAVLVWPIAVPCNLTLTASHGSAVVATTVTVTGYDVFKNKMVKTMTATAGTTSKTDATTAAFAYVSSIAFTSAGNATTNTISIGIGEILGLPYKLTAKEDVLGTWFNQAVDSATIVPAVTSAVSATSGDVRGTVDLAGTPDGTKTASINYFVRDPNTSTGIAGIPQYAG